MSDVLMLTSPIVVNMNKVQIKEFLLEIEASRNDVLKTAALVDPRHFDQVMT